jgi:hypothetical protein
MRIRNRKEKMKRQRGEKRIDGREEERKEENEMRRKVYVKTISCA